MRQRRSNVPESAARGTIDVAEDMAFQRRTWTVERIAWVLMALLILAALLGLFSAGPLSGARAGDPNGLLVAYERFQRYHAPATIRVDLAPAAVQADGVSLDVSRTFVDALEIERIRPEPRESKATGDGLRFVFDAVPGQSASVYFHVRPEKVGFVDARIGLAGGAAVAIGPFVYP